MWALLSPVLMKLAIWVGAALAVVFVYLGIKRKGKLEERAKWQEAQAKATQEFTSGQLDAIKKDQEVDRHVREKIDEVKKSATVPGVASDNKFHF